MVQVTKPLGFIARHGLWTDDQRRQAEDLKRRIETDKLHLVRLAWADPHGASRAKALTPPGFLAALTSGHNINVATTTLDSANARTFNSFTRGGGMGLDEMTGSPNLVIIPDASTFRTLRFGFSDSHAKGMALQVNNLLDHGAIKVASDGTFSLDLAKTKKAVVDLTHDILTLQAHGDYAGTQALLKRMVVIRPEVQRVLDRLTDVPVDIAPRHVTAEELTRQ